MMRVSREEALENRMRVLDTASRLFRENGYDGIGIAALMKAAGLTNGAFYKQFASKDALMAEATAYAFSKNMDFWRKGDGTDLSDPEPKFVQDWYLSETHADKRATGCTFAALGSDAPRQSREVRQAFDKGIHEMAAVISGENTASDEIPDETALKKISLIVGALLLSRAVDDPKLKEAILHAAKK